MEEVRTISEYYTELGDKVIRENSKLHWIADVGLSVGFMKSNKEKTKGKALVFGECEKVPAKYKEFIPYDFLITVYEINCAGFTEEQIKILLYHELLHVGMDDSGKEVKYIINPHDVEDFREIIDKYGLDWCKS